MMWVSWGQARLVRWKGYDRALSHEQELDTKYTSHPKQQPATLSDCAGYFLESALITLHSSGSSKGVEKTPPTVLSSLPTSSSSSLLMCSIWCSYTPIRRFKCSNFGSLNNCFPFSWSSIFRRLSSSRRSNCKRRSSRDANTPSR
jgi:hypothetical protein